MNPDEKRNNAVMLYDGDCGFCQHWVNKWSKIAHGKVRFEPYQIVLPDYPQVTREQCREAIRLILPDGRYVSAAHAVFKMLELSGRYRWLLRLYEKDPIFRLATEAGYRWVSRNRAFLSRFYGLPQCRL